METFTDLKKIMDNPYYNAQKQKILLDLTDDMIDTPIISLIKRFNKLPYCFTLQSCYGHFRYNGQKESYNLETLLARDINTQVEYRIAYIAFCIKNSLLGRGLFKSLQKITAINPGNIQFCCADWFWEKQINSYVLQVEPGRLKHQDTAILALKEVLHIGKIRNKFFSVLYELVENEKY